eukprot:g1529.t1
MMATFSSTPMSFSRPDDFPARKTLEALSSVSLIDHGLSSLRDVRCAKDGVGTLNLHGNRIRQLDVRDICELFPDLEELIVSSNEIEVGVSYTEEDALESGERQPPNLLHHGGKSPRTPATTANGASSSSGAQGTNYNRPAQKIQTGASGSKGAPGAGGATSSSGSKSVSSRPRGASGEAGATAKIRKNAHVEEAIEGDDVEMAPVAPVGPQVEHLQQRRPPPLQVLDLSCNRVGPSLRNLHLFKPTLLKLLLPYNRLKGLDGLKPLWGGCLQTLDVRSNAISRLDQLFFLSGLRELEDVALSHNPICDMGVVHHRFRGMPADHKTPNHMGINLVQSYDEITSGNPEQERSKQQGHLQQVATLNEEKLRTDLIKIDAEFQRREKKRLELESRLRENTKVVEHLLKENLELRSTSDSLRKRVLEVEEGRKAAEAEREALISKNAEQQALVPHQLTEDDLLSAIKTSDLYQAALLAKATAEREAQVGSERLARIEAELKAEREEYEELKQQSERVLKELQGSVGEISARMVEQDKFFQDSLAAERSKFASVRRQLEAEARTAKEEAGREVQAELGRAQQQNGALRERADQEWARKLADREEELERVCSRKLRDAEEAHARARRGEQYEAERKLQEELRKQSDELAIVYAEKLKQLSADLQAEQERGAKELQAAHTEHAAEQARRLGKQAAELSQKFDEAVRVERGKTEEEWKKLLKECLQDAKRSVESRSAEFERKLEETQSGHRKDSDGDQLVAEMRLCLEKAVLEKAQAEVVLETERERHKAVVAEHTEKNEKRIAELVADAERKGETSRREAVEIVELRGKEELQLQRKVIEEKERELKTMEEKYEKKLMERLHAQREDFEKVDLKLKKVQIEDLTSQVAAAAANLAKVRDEALEVKKKRDREWQNRVDEEVALQRALQSEVELWKAEKLEKIDLLEAEKQALEEEVRTAKAEQADAYREQIQALEQDLERERNEGLDVLRRQVEEKLSDQKRQLEMEWNGEKLKISLEHGEKLQKVQSENLDLQTQVASWREGTERLRDEVRNRDKEIRVLMGELQKQKSVVKDRVKAFLKNLDNE